MDDKAKQEVIKHLKEHMTYPASKSAIVQECHNMEHLPADARSWVQSKLADRTYNSADEAIKSLGL